MNRFCSAFRRTMLSSLALIAFASAAHAQTSLWLEAECAQVGSTWNRVTDSAASNSQYVTIQPGNNSTASAPGSASGHVSFPINVTTAGTYRLNARMLGPSPNDDSFWVRMDSGSWIMWNNWWNTSWIWVQLPNTFNLGTGNHTLTIAYREDGTRLDKINLTTGTSLPGGMGSPSQQLLDGNHAVGFAERGERGGGSQQHGQFQRHFQ